MDDIDYTLLAKKLSDQYWRLNNLYWITNKDGEKVKFTMNYAQLAFFKSYHYRNIILKARQLGFSTLLQIFMLDTCLFNPNTACGVIAQTLKDAIGIFSTKALFAYDNLPEVIKNSVVSEDGQNRGVRFRTKTEIEFWNGSKIMVGTSLRSGTYQYIHVSEFGKIAARARDRAQEIVTGTLPTLGKNGIGFIESTAEGTGGKFFEMVSRSRSKDADDLNEGEWKFFFFPWWENPEYERDPSRVKISPELDKYFTELEEEHQITLSDAKKAWYSIEKEESVGEGMTREFPSHPDEAFSAPIEGAYYGELMSKAEKEGRITTVPFDPRYKVETSWDIGVRDDTVIWAAQRLPSGQINIINFYKNTEKPIHHYKAILEKWADDLDYRYSRHILPHDSVHRDLTHEELKSPKEVLEDLGLKNVVVAIKATKQIGIHAVRDIIPRCYFDQTKCKPGVDALKSYKKEWDDKNGVWRDEPRHDEASHAADAFRYLATAPELIPQNYLGDADLKIPSFGV